MPSSETEAPVVVIGYGNELRGDDGAGPAAAEELRQRLGRGSAEVVTAHQLLPELAERISRAILVIFIDASTDAPAGGVRKKWLTASAGGRGGGGGAMGHHESPENLLEMALALYGHAPPGLLVSIGAGDLGFRLGLSGPARQAVDEVARQVIHTIEQFAMTPEAHHA
jgi:hydrogenase maturation protease